MEMEQLSGGQLVAKSLVAEGVTHIFTLGGGHVAPICRACQREGLRVIDMRHEQAAVMAADGFARQTRQPAAALVTAGPGVTNAVTGIATAHHAQSPVVVIGGRSPYADRQAGDARQLDHTALLEPVTKWSRAVPETRRIPEFVSMAFRHADTGVRGPVFLEMPADILWGGAEVSPQFVRSRTKAHQLGDPAYVEAAVARLREARRPVVVAGAAAWWHGAAEDLVGLAERLGAPVFTSGMGRGSVAPGHRLYFEHARREALAKADVILALGAPTDFRVDGGQPSVAGASAKVIQIDLDPAAIGLDGPVDVGIVGDAQAVLRQMNECLATDREPLARAEWLGALREVEARAREKIDALARRAGSPPNGLRICREVADVADDDTIIVADGFDVVSMALKVIPTPRPGGFMDAGVFGCLGVGPSFAIAAKLAHPHKRVILLTGDGSFGLNGLELDTAVRHRIPFVTVIANDAGWSPVHAPHAWGVSKESSDSWRIPGLKNERAEDEAAAAAAGRASTGLAETRYDEIARAVGGWGAFVERAEDIGPALRDAIESNRPACVNVRMDPDIAV